MVQPAGIANSQGQPRQCGARNLETLTNYFSNNTTPLPRLSRPGALKLLLNVLKDPTYTPTQTEKGRSKVTAGEEADTTREKRSNLLELENILVWIIWCNEWFRRTSSGRLAWGNNDVVSSVKLFPLVMKHLRNELLTLLGIIVVHESMCVMKEAKCVKIVVAYEIKVLRWVYCCILF